VPLVLDTQGHRLAKRQQSAGLAPLKARGSTPEQVVGKLAASCGLVDPGTALRPNALAKLYASSSCDIIRTKIRNQQSH
jgi:glutamyl-tRNA synthetase